VKHAVTVHRRHYHRSFPPSQLAGANERSSRRVSSRRPALKEAQDDATALSIHTQARIGLDFLRRRAAAHSLSSYSRRFEGIDLEHELVKKRSIAGVSTPRPVAARRRRDKRRAPRIVEDLRSPKRKRTSRSKWMCRVDDVIDSTLDDFYKDEVAMAMDVAAALNEELRDLQAAGWTWLEIDEPQ